MVRPQLFSFAPVLSSVPENPESERKLTGERYETHLVEVDQQVRADRSANGGKLTTGEKKQINGEQNAASKNIYNKKHNARTQPGAKPKS
jgi:hypothetical protein